MQQTSAKAGPKKLDVGAKLFFTSAKTGGGTAVDVGDVVVTPVNEIFDYLARRVVTRWEWEEQLVDDPQESVPDEDARRSGRRRDALAIRLTETWNGLVHGRREACCSV